MKPVGRSRDLLDKRDPATILYLPQHLLAFILSFLAHKDLAQARLVDTRFRDASSFAIRRLRLSSLSSSDRLFVHHDLLKRFPEVETLDLSMIASSTYGDELDSILRCLRSGQRLSTLMVRGARRRPIGEGTGKLLGSLTSLRSLDVSDSILHRSGLEHLGTLQQLTFLSLHSCGGRMDSASVALLVGRLTSLQDIDLGGCQMVNDVLLDALSELPWLKKCNLSSCDGFTANGLAKLCSVQSLRALLLPACWHLNDACMEAIATNAAGLECLSLFEGGETVTDVGLACLTALTKLTCLDLGYACWAHTSEGLKTLLPRLPALRLLNLGGAEGVRDSVLLELLRNPPTALTSLDVSECQRVTAVGMDALKSLSNLKELNIGWNLRLSDDALQGALSTSLTKLDLSYCADLTNKALAATATLPNLSCLQLRRCGRITDEGLAMLASGKAPIRALDVSHCHGITSAGIRALIPLVTLETLILAGCPRATTVLGFAALSSFSSALQCLDASHNPRLDDGCLNALSFAFQLRRVSLRSCPRITDYGIMALSRISRLERLDVDECRGVSYHGAMQLKRKLPLLRGPILVSPLNGPGPPLYGSNALSYVHGLPGDERSSMPANAGDRNPSFVGPGSPVIRFPLDAEASHHGYIS